MLQCIDQQGPSEARNETLLVEDEKGKNLHQERRAACMVLDESGGGWCEVGGYMTGNVSGSRPSTLRLIEKNLE